MIWVALAVPALFVVGWWVIWFVCEILGVDLGDGTGDDPNVASPPW